MNDHVHPIMKAALEPVKPKIDPFKVKTGRPPELKPPTIPPKIDLPAPAKVPVYRQSMINMGLKCMEQLRFRYMEGIIVAPTGAQTVGSSTHAAIARNLIVKKENGVGCSLEESLDVFSTDFELRSQETEFKEDENKDALKDVGAQCVSAHHREIAPTIQPVSVEENFVIETDAGFNLEGTIDCVDADTVIRDAKTSKGKYDPDSVVGAVQPAMYDFAYEAIRGEKSAGFQYDVLIKPTKTIGARTQTVRAKVTDEDRQWLFNAVTQVDRAVKAGIFIPAAEGAWWCSKKWCGYAAHGICKKFQRAD